jgi:hypothetical protein
VWHQIRRFESGEVSFGQPWMTCMQLRLGMTVLPLLVERRS